METLTCGVRLGRFKVLDELDGILFRSKGLRLKDLFWIACKSSSLIIVFEIGNLVIAINDFGEFKLFDDGCDAEDRKFSISLRFENREKKSGTAIKRKYTYSAKELENFLKIKTGKGVRRQQKWRL